jgi:electron transfer flavoprotein beta subunit
VRILVTVKHVPDTTEVRFDAGGDLMVRQAPTKINDYDRNALEAAAQLKESGHEFVIGCVGPAEAAKTLKEALAYGGEYAVLVSGPWAEGLTSDASARLLSAVATAEGPFDLILSGDVSEDGYDGLVPGLVAASLGVPYLRGVIALSVGDGVLDVERGVDDAVETWRVSAPAALSVTRLVNVPRTITTMQVMKVPISKVRTVSAGHVGVDESSLAPEAVAVRPVSVRPATQARRNEMLTGDPDDVVAALISHLSDLGVLS